MITDLGDNQFLMIKYHGGPQILFRLMEFDPWDHRSIGVVEQYITLHDTDREINSHRIMRTIANLRGCTRR